MDFIIRGVYSVPFDREINGNITLSEHPHGGLITTFFTSSVSARENNNSNYYTLFVSHFIRKDGEWLDPVDIGGFRTPGIFSHTCFLNLRGDLSLYITVNGKLWKWTSHNYGKTWPEKSIAYHDAENWVVYNPPVYIGAARLILPLHNAAFFRSFFLISDDLEKTWYPSNFIEPGEDFTKPPKNRDKKSNAEYSANGNGYPTLFPQSENMVTALMRPYNGKFILRSDSFNGGEVWTDAKRTNLRAHSFNHPYYT